MTKGMFRIIAGFLVLLVLLLANPMVIISAGRRGVILNLGAVSEKIMGEGLNFRTPFIQNVVKMDVQIQKDEVQTDAASKDLQTVTTTIALNYHIMPDEVNTLYQSIGKDFKKRIIDPAIQEAVKAATAKFTAEEVITKREIVRDEVKRLLLERLRRDYIIVDEVSIVNFKFSTEFDKAIEAKVTAEQNALTAKNVLETKKFEAEQILATARAEAEKIRIQVESIAKQGGIYYVQLRAIEKWDGKLPVQMIPDGAVPFLNLMKQ